MNDLIRHLSCCAGLLAGTGLGLREFVKAAATIVVGAALGWHGLNASAGEFAAAEARTAHSDIAELERAFWLCDHAATHRALSPDVGVLCFAVTDELKQQKFGGNLEQMLAWWQTRRVAEHRRLDEADPRWPRLLAP